MVLAHTGPAQLPVGDAVPVERALGGGQIVHGIGAGKPRLLRIPPQGICPQLLRKILLTREQYRRYKQSLFTLSNVRASTVEDELACVDAMEGHDFEHWGADLLRDLGFTKVEVTRGSGDQGVDILAEKDGIRYAVQCKRYHSPLGNKPVQEVHAGKEMYQCQIGAVMTNRYFTPSGREIAEKTGVLLWDRDWLRDAINRRQIG